MCAVNCPCNARKMDNVIKPCFNSVPLNICRGPGDILSSYITQSIRDISYCSRDTWNMLSHCITNYSHRTPVGLHNFSSIKLVMNWRFSIENLNLSRNSLSSKSNSICRYTLSFCSRLVIFNQWLNIYPAKIEGLTLSTG